MEEATIMTDWQWGFTWCLIIEVIAWNVLRYFIW